MSGNCFSSCIQKVPGKVNAGEFQVNASLTPPRWRCFAKLLKQLKLFRLLDLYLPTLGSRHKPKIRLKFSPLFPNCHRGFFHKGHDLEFFRRFFKDFWDNWNIQWITYLCVCVLCGFRGRLCVAGKQDDWTRNATNFDSRNCKQNHPITKIRPRYVQWTTMWATLYRVTSH